MTHVAIFLGFSFFLLNLLLFTEWKKKMAFKTLASLFLFGIFLSTPFILVEYLQDNLKYYLVLLAFIAIELSVLYFERRVQYFHDLIHHNVKNLRMLSFFVVGIGFAYSELAFYIFHSHESAMQILNALPARTIYAIFMHTVLTTAASLTHVGNMIAERFYETVFKFLSYYLRIAAISTSHFLYVLFVEHNFTFFLVPLLALSIAAFFHYKKTLDGEPLPA